MRQVCTNCWQIRADCFCENSNFQEIDKNMIEILSILNKKGYKTKYSCGGHATKNFIFIYISFYKHYFFQELPKKFSYKKRVLFYGQKNAKQKDIDEKITILKDWAKKL